MYRMIKPFKNRNAIAAVLISAISFNSFALGGLDTAKTTADEIRVGLYALIGAVAGIYLLWLGLMAKTEKKSWADFGWGAVYISLVGGSVALATWVWSLFAA